MRCHSNAAVIDRKCAVSPTDGEEYPTLTSFAEFKRMKTTTFQINTMVKIYFNMINRAIYYVDEKVIFQTVPRFLGLDEP